MKRSTKIDATVLLSGAILLGIGIVMKDEIARDFGLVLLAKALPRPSEYGRIAKQVMRRGKA